jgi:hypothetical protein
LRPAFRNYWLWVGLVVVLLVFLAYVYILGYHFPQADAHPDWPAFPRLKTQHLVVERIADFDSLYGRRLHLRRSYEGNFLEGDSPRVSAVHVLGHRVRYNTFKASSGYYRSPVEAQGFNQYGDTYLEVEVAGEKGYCKTDYSSFFPALDEMHQFNQPTTRQDTLLLRVDFDHYRIFIR